MPGFSKGRRALAETWVETVWIARASTIFATCKKRVLLNSAES